MKTLYHITSAKNAIEIKINGFKNGRLHFAKAQHVWNWFGKMKTHLNLNSWDEMAVIEAEVPDDFYRKEIFDGDKDQFWGGNKGEVHYGEGKLGWSHPIKRPMFPMRYIKEIHYHFKGIEKVCQNSMVLRLKGLLKDRFSYNWERILKISRNNEARALAKYLKDNPVFYQRSVIKGGSML